ncbi:MAG TPA: hypothetical protein VGH28_21010 [Polyangiaceae bacterium]|jgi:hypothetical protein
MRAIVLLPLAVIVGACSSEPTCSGGTITVHNFESSCTVSLNGAASSVTTSYDTCVPFGNSAPIVVGPASATNELGPTPFVRMSGLEVPDGSLPGKVDGDGGLGSTNTVIVGVSSATGCVLVCCPLADGTGCDSSASGFTSFLTTCSP